jgi:hypothetical protein
MAYILNNTTKNLSVVIVGQFNQARFFLGPSQFASVGLSPGLKALLAFSNQGLYAMRPIRATAPGQTFFVNPSPAPPNIIVRVHDSFEPDQANLDNFEDFGNGEVQETDLIEPLSPLNF